MAKMLDTDNNNVTSSNRSKSNNDSPGNKKRKKPHNKSSNSKNPLSQARGKQQSHENIWFRRIGAGYHLFVEYYAGQPMGTVCEEGHECNDPKANNVVGVAIPKASGGGGAGLSRAAKRRKKKKQKSPHNHNELVDAIESKRETQTLQVDRKVSSSESQTIDNSHPLLQALEKHASKSSSLRPFVVKMAQPLPLTFRLRRSLDSTIIHDLQSKIQSQFDTNLVKHLPFGDQLIYQTSCSKANLKEYPDLKNFLMEHSQDGSLARQEIGSMLPVLALEQVGGFHRNNDNPDKKKNKKLRILDMCASPGSKTLQALEMLLPINDKDEKSAVVDTQKPTSSRILANDVSESRLQALKEAIERSGMPAELLSRVGYSCHDARRFPVHNDSNHSHNQKSWNTIICDVPCSGDGTIRKESHILELWKPYQGQILHATQLQILQRALQLVAVGGVVCYSTCSLNPIENEAVVAAALRHFNAPTKSDSSKSKHDKKESSPKQQTAVEAVESFELLEFPTLNGFCRRPGLSHWRVADYHVDDEDDEDEFPHLVWYDTYQKAMDESMEDALPTMWPPKDGDVQSLHLDRCTRLWPQDHDSGGFFLALIRRNR